MCLDNGNCVAVLAATILLVESLRLLLPILPGHGVLEIKGGSIGIDVQIKTSEGTAACAVEVRSVLRCYFS